MATKHKNDIPAKVYKELADQIKQDSDGLEYSESECEVIKNGLTYSVNYRVTREYNTTYPEDSFTEPETTSKTYCDIRDYLVTNADGEPVNVTMDTDEIVSYFDTLPQYCDED
jgi:hypothetical protein